MAALDVELNTNEIVKRVEDAQLRFEKLNILKSSKIVHEQPIYVLVNSYAIFLNFRKLTELQHSQENNQTDLLASQSFNCSSKKNDIGKCK